MLRRDYERLAAWAGRTLLPLQIESLCRLLKENYADFKEEKFLRAAGYTPEMIAFYQKEQTNA